MSGVTNGKPSGAATSGRSRLWTALNGSPVLAGIAAALAAAVIIGLATWAYKSLSGGDQPNSGAAPGASAQVAPTTSSDSTTPTPVQSSTPPANEPSASQVSTAVPNNPAPAPPLQRYLSQLSSLIGTRTPTSIRFGTIELPRSVKISCGPEGTSNFTDWKTDGATVFDALVGIPDDQTATNAHATILVEDQNQRTLVPPFNVSPGGTPHRLQRLPLGRAVQLRVECISVDERNPGAERLFSVGLGNAFFSP